MVVLLCEYLYVGLQVSCHRIATRCYSGGVSNMSSPSVLLVARRVAGRWRI